MIRTFLLAAIVGATTLFASCTKNTTTNDNPCTAQCVNGGTCVNNKCSCPTGYEGANCQNPWNAKFSGAYHKQGSSNYITATPSSVKPDIFSMANLDLLPTMVCRRVDSVHYSMDSVTIYSNGGDFYKITGGSGGIDEAGIRLTGVYYARSVFAGQEYLDTTAYDVVR